jgi:hypothetical protein
MLSTAMLDQDFCPKLARLRSEPFFVTLKTWKNLTPQRKTSGGHMSNHQPFTLDGKRLFSYN